MAEVFCFGRCVPNYIIPNCSDFQLLHNKRESFCKMALRYSGGEKFCNIEKFMMNITNNMKAIEKLNSMNFVL